MIQWCKSFPTKNFLNITLDISLNKKISFSKFFPCSSSIYTHFLNVQGRVLFDAFIFRDDLNKGKSFSVGINILSRKFRKLNVNSFIGFLLDCDKNQASTILQHLKMYKLRRKVDLQLLDNLRVWSVFCGPSGEKWKDWKYQIFKY